MRFRTKALAKRRQADELDRLPEVARPRGWLAALALAIVALGLVVYAVVGEIPRRVEATGVLSTAGGVVEVQSNESGVVEKLLVEPGDKVTDSTPVAEIKTESGERTQIEAGYEGVVLDIRTAAGHALAPGEDVVSIARDPAEPLTTAYLFVPQDSAAGIGPGMLVDMDVAAAPAAVYGRLHGEVESVGGAPISPQELDALVANDALAEQFSADGPPVVATVKLHEGEGLSGLEFSAGSGPDYPLRPGAVVAADIQQGGQSVIDVVLGGR